MFARFVVGWAVAVSGIADVAYLHEISSVWEEDCSATTLERESSIDETNNEDMSSENESGVQTASDKSTGGRGSVVSVNEACISLGFLLAFGVAFALGGNQSAEDGANEQASNAWRYMFGFGGLIALVQFIGMMCMPESPVWLREKGRLQEALSARNRIRGTPMNVGDGRVTQHITMSASNTNQSENDGIEMAKNSQPTSPENFRVDAQPATVRNSRATNCLVYLWIKMRSAPTLIKANYQQLVNEMLVPYKRQCIISFFLAASQQFCGHPSVLSFSAEIFAMLNGNEVSANDTNIDGEEDLTPIELTVGIGVLKFLTTCIVILCIERGGRRFWLLSGMTCILLSLSFLCIAFIGRDDESISDSSTPPHDSSSLKNDLGIVGIYGVAVGYAASYGPLTWLITSELFPSSIRGRALGFATVVTYVAAGLVSRTFLSLQESIGLAATFALYWVATFISIVFVWLAVPDTKMNPEEISEEMNSLWIWGGRRRGSMCPLLLRWRSRSGDRPPTSRTTSWTSLASVGYGSWYGSKTEEHPEVSTDSPSNSATTRISSSSTAHSPGLTTRRSSNGSKEIV